MWPFSVRQDIYHHFPSALRLAIERLAAAIEGNRMSKQEDDLKAAATKLKDAVDALQTRLIDPAIAAEVAANVSALADTIASLAPHPTP